MRIVAGSISFTVCATSATGIAFPLRMNSGTISQEILEKGHHYVEVALNEVPLFIRKGKAIPVADVAQTVKDIDPSTIRMIGYEGAEYDRYDDDGVSTL